MKKGIKRWMRAFSDKLNEAARTKTSTHEIALGMCVGTFIGFLPLFGFQILVGIAAIILFRINKIATFLGILITNPITLPPIFAFNYYVGTLLVGGPKVMGEGAFAVENILPYVRPLVIGSLLVGTIACIIAYIVTYQVVKNIRKRLKSIPIIAK